MVSRGFGAHVDPFTRLGMVDRAVRGQQVGDTAAALHPGWQEKRKEYLAKLKEIVDKRVVFNFGWVGIQGM